MNVQSSTIGILYDFMGFIDDYNDGALWLNFLVEIPWDGDFVFFFFGKGIDIVERWWLNGQKMAYPCSP